MSEETKLLPCPFCGSEPNEQDREMYGRKGTRFFCDGGVEHAVFVGGFTRDEAIKEWNRRAGAWHPEFDATSVKQEQLVKEFCFEIAGPRGKKGSPPDPVRLLDMAQALYEAELTDLGPKP